jgi:hypothetical protein
MGNPQGNFGSGNNFNGGAAPGSGTNSNNAGNQQSTNFNNSPAQSQNAVGITGMAVPRKDQTLQDRQFGTLGSGMVGTNFGTGTNSSASAPKPTPPKPAPAVVKPPPKPIPKPIVTIKAPVKAPVAGTKYPGIGGSTGAAAESDYDKTNWTGINKATGPKGPGSAMGLPGRARGGGFGGGGRNGAIVSGNYVEAPGGAQVDPMTGQRGLRHRQQVENQVRQVFGARPDGAAGGGRPMQGYAGGGASNLPKRGSGSPGGWGPAGQARQEAQRPQPRYLGTDRATANSSPRTPNPRYVPPRGGRGEGGGMGSQVPTGQGFSDKEPGGWA